MTETVIADDAAFDSVAGAYDREEAGNPIRQVMRRRSLAILESTFPPGARLLDVGCGTGTEAIWLAGRGRSLFAVDASPRMLEVLTNRADQAGLAIPTRTLHARDLVTLVDTLGEGSFDGAYSSFGALNTEPSLEPPLAGLSRLVRPGGRIVLGVMNRWCVAEMAALAAGGRPRQALRRARSSLQVTVGSNVAEVRYPSWRQLRRALHDQFRVVRVEALPLVLLPYAWAALSPHRRVYSAASRLDAVLSPHRPFAWLGDHLVVVAERRGRQGGNSALSPGQLR